MRKFHFKKRPLKTALILVFISTLALSCGEMDILGGQNNYSVNMLIDGLSLDECSIIKSSSSIVPYFDGDISDDADTQALRVIIKDSKNKAIAAPIRYQLSADARRILEEQEAEDSEEELKETEKTEKTAETDEKGLTDKAEQMDKPTETTPVKKDAEKTEDGSESKLDEPKEAEDFDNAPDTVYEVNSFEKKLPLFSFPANTEAGFYTIYFEIISLSGEVLKTIDNPVYFIAGATLRIDNLHSYLGGVSETPHVVPPGVPVLLEAKISADKSIKPYIIWNYGKTRIAGDAVLGGASKIIWKSPEETGFMQIQVEVFPFDPSKNSTGIHGLKREISLPVSENHGRHGYFSETQNDLSLWYEFAGVTTDSNDKLNKQKDLASVSRKPPVWLCAFGTYGLGVGTSDVWSLPNEPFKKLKLFGGTALLRLRVSSLKAGNLFETELFDSGTGLKYLIRFELDGYTLKTICEKQGILYTSETPIMNGRNDFAVLAIEFIFVRNEILINTACEEDGELKKWSVLSIPGSADGKGNIYFGRKTNLQNSKTVESCTAIISELALSYHEKTNITQEKADESKKEQDNDDGVKDRTAAQTAASPDN
ncbi:MAG: hypothetical protein Ta2G_12430 [Termitinemataceae bacterium]|nr:MAG: hypothetical protein Ta2G_12430 [Termitinemataceae bacterium]